MARSVPSLPLGAAAPEAGVHRRDTRVDMLRGLALLTIFINHIPYNSLTYLTLRPYGFSDAAEIFVFLAGYSAWMRYPALIERQGWAAGLRRIGHRCLAIWGAHALLLCGTVLLVMLRYHATGRLSADVEPLIGDGVAGLMRGLTLQALPAYLDILPLYIVLIGGFPLLFIGMRRSLAATLAVSAALYLLTMTLDWNLPNQIDPRSAKTAWSFNPFAWQLVFVLGALAAEGRCRGWAWLARPPLGLRLCAVAVLAFGLLALDPYHRWPTLAGRLFPSWALADSWKSCAAPWRIVHALCLLYLLLTASLTDRIAALAPGRVAQACGRHSLAVFSAGCMLGLLGRFAYGDLGISPVLQISVNGIGIGAMTSLAFWLERRRPKRRLARLEGRIVQERLT